MTKTDVSFDGRAQRFQQRIYQGDKGELRLQAIWQALLREVPTIAGPEPLVVWDAGGGLGQFSALLAAQGHRVLLSDISSEMLDLAGQALAEPVARGKIQLNCSAIQQLAPQLPPQSLILCHAVLEWLAEPKAVLSLLAASLAPGGYLSLTFYNRLALIWMNVLKGNFNMVLTDQLSGHPGSLTPPGPLLPATVSDWLAAEGLQPVYQGGVRLAYDYLSRPLRASRSREDLQAIEQYLQQFPELAALGRYYHIIVRKPAAGAGPDVAGH